MTYPVTIADIKRRARQRADMASSGFISDSTIMDMINEAYAEWYDLVVSAYENYYVSITNITLTRGTPTYPMPDDFYKIIGVDFKLGTDQYLTLGPYNEVDRNTNFTSNNNIPNGEVRIRYISAPQIFTTDTDTFDSIAGWESMLITDVAIMMLEKEESDTRTLEARRERQERRIKEMSHNRDVGMPGTVSDVYQYNVYQNFASLRYRLYGNDLRFISTELTGSNLLYGLGL